MKKKVAIGALLLVVISVAGLLLLCDMTPCLKVRAALGSTSAMVLLAETLNDGGDEYGAFKLYEKAAKKGDSAAYTDYGRFLLKMKWENESATATTWLERGFAETGDAEAALALGKYYWQDGGWAEGASGITKATDQADGYLEAAAIAFEKNGREEEFIEAAFLLAIMNYLSRYGILNYAKSAYWFEKILEKRSATKTNPRLENFYGEYDICNLYYYLGIIYKMGRHGVSRDETKGKKYLILAHDTGRCEWKVEPEIMKMAYTGELGGAERKEAVKHVYRGRRGIGEKEMEQISRSCDQEVIIYSAGSGLVQPDDTEEFVNVDIRITRKSNEYRIYSEYDGKNGVHRNENPLNVQDWQKIQNIMTDSGFWDFPTTPDMIGVDGPSLSLFAMTCDKIQYVWDNWRPEMMTLRNEFLDIIKRSAKQDTVPN